MSNPYDRSRYGNPTYERARSPGWNRERDEDPNEERNMWQGREEDGGWGHERAPRDHGQARNDGGAIRFERGNERRYPDAAYGLDDGQTRRGDYERAGYERSDYDRRVTERAGSPYDPSRDYSRGFGPNHGFGYPRQAQQAHRADARRGFSTGGYDASRGASPYSPTGLDRDRLRARGEQGYGRELGGFAGRGPKGYKRTDERIREDVCERLSQDDDVDASEISVRVESGEVTLEGSVETRRQKHRAEELAADVLGVDDVHNSVRVRKSMLSELKDKVTGDEPPTGGHAGSGTKTTVAARGHDQH